jgi:hypothetical protein
LLQGGALVEKRDWESAITAFDAGLQHRVEEVVANANVWRELQCGKEMTSLGREIQHVEGEIARLNGGDIVCTLQWNNSDDLDLHCQTPHGLSISFKAKNADNGQLDADVNAVGGIISHEPELQMQLKTQPEPEPEQEQEQPEPEPEPEPETETETQPEPQPEDQPKETIRFARAPWGKYIFSVHNFKRRVPNRPTPFTVQLMSHDVLLESVNFDDLPPGRPPTDVITWEWKGAAQIAGKRSESARLQELNELQQQLSSLLRRRDRLNATRCGWWRVAR